MGTVEIAHHSEMTPEGTMQVFRSHFGSKYDVYMTRLPGWDFVVKKSGWTGVAVKLKQENAGTSFVLWRCTPGVLQKFLGGPLLTLILWRRLKALEEEVRVFITNAADFR